MATPTIKKETHQPRIDIRIFDAVYYIYCFIPNVDIVLCGSPKEVGWTKRVRDMKDAFDTQPGGGYVTNFERPPSFLKSTRCFLFLRLSDIVSPTLNHLSEIRTVYFYFSTCWNELAKEAVCLLLTGIWGLRDRYGLHFIYAGCDCSLTRRIGLPTRGIYTGVYESYLRGICVLKHSKNKNKSNLNPR
ncbi:hypothetical protein K445DRAFT_116965 [Daldinia sp. EC12]|nr:hypothetical protein K445DRAFT_116965 [Daldinia sp. EC12]